MKATIYKVRTIEALMMDEMGTRFWTYIPSNHIYYKFELLGTYEVELPEGVEVINTTGTGYPTFWRGREYLDYYTEGDKFFLMGDDGKPIELIPQEIK